MDLYDRLDEIIAYVEDARAVPLSSSCLVHRGELLGLLDDLRADLPAEVRHARALLDGRDEVLTAGEQEATRVVGAAEQEASRVLAAAKREAERALAAAEAEARRMLDMGEQEHARLVSEAEVTVAAEAEAARIRQEAHVEAQRMQQEVDDYVEARMAHFEGVLHRTLQTVERGRERMRTRTPS